MRMMWSALALLALAGCTDTVVLSPANQQAETIGKARLHWVEGLPGGPMNIVLPSGENLPGDFSISEAAAPPVSLEGGDPAHFGLAGGNFSVTAHSARTAMACRASIVQGHGAGYCRDQFGGLYRIEL